MRPSRESTPLLTTLQERSALAVGYQRSGGIIDWICNGNRRQRSSCFLALRVARYLRFTMRSLFIRLLCLLGHHDFNDLGGVAYGGAPLKSGVEVCVRCQLERVDELVLAFFMMECKAKVVSSGLPFAEPSPKLRSWAAARPGRPEGA